MRAFFIFVVAVFVHMAGAFTWPGSAAADESRPVYVEVTQLANQSYRLDWKIPPVIPVHALPSFNLPEDCERAGGDKGPIEVYEGSAFYTCGSSLAGRRLHIDYPMFNPALSAMVRSTALSGEEHLGVLSPQELTWRIPDAETRANVALQYTWLGIEHIWAGLDHLLFVTCLLWIAGTVRRILIAVTGFTAAHSVTLILSSLELVRIPVPPTEAVIAFSIVFLAREIAVNLKDSLTWRFPAAVSTSFGLLHGLGFASALTQIGLPQTAMLTGLLCFNLGVEIGQILFVAAVGAFYFAGRATARRWSACVPSMVRRSVNTGQIQILGSYTVGLVATYWLISRIADFIIYPQ